MDKAMAIIDQAIAQDPGNDEPHLMLAAVYQANRDWEKMLQACDRAIALKPDFGASYTIRAIAYNNLDQPARALQDSTRALDLDPLNHLLVINRAKIYVRMEAFEQAAADFRKASQVDLEASKKLGRPPSDAVSCLLAAAEMLDKAGKQAEADQARREAKELEQTLAAPGKSGCGKAAAVILLMVLWWVL
ncbi:hypothetical protein DYH09_09575 [bacterium CPR1]|nr:hypothetical protein [bacterium CPR1]